VCLVVGDNKPTKSQEVGKRVLELKFKSLQNVAYKPAGTPVKVCLVVGDNKPTKSQEVGKRVLELKFKSLQNVAYKPAGTPVNVCHHL
jgi:arginyl-tRNA--protein-N-Asp/Glu arginylyltransferase